MLFAALFLTASTLLCSAPERPFSDLTFEAALAEAKRSEKVVMIDFFTTWCGPCKKLDRTTWKDPKVVEWLAAKCVALKIDAEKEAPLAKRFGVMGYPTILFVNSDGTELDRLVGYRDGAKFLEEAASSLRGKTALTRSTEKLQGSDPNPMDRQSYAGELVRARKYDEALKEYLWCFDEGKAAQPSYSGVRLSFLLGDIVELGRVHPPALQALRERRDAAEARIDAGSNSFDAASDACALSRALGEPDRILALYDRVRKGKPLAGRLRIAFGQPVLEPLVEARRYDEVAELFDSPEGYVKSHLQMFTLRPRPSGGADEVRRAVEDSVEPSLRASVVEDASVMYEALVGAGRDDVAGRVADSLIAFANVGNTYSTLIDRAIRAGKLDTARALAERGLSSLPDDEKASVRAARERIPSAK